MPAPSTESNEVRLLLQEAGLTAKLFFWNGPDEVILTVEGSRRAFFGRTPRQAIESAEYEMYKGL